VEAILTAPGMLHELETRVVDNRVQRVYKNAWPSLRAFWLWACQQHGTQTYLVFENTRLTFSETLLRSIKVAAMLQDVYGLAKGDRVSIVSRNYPEYMVCWWACHLFGAVPCLVNALRPFRRVCLNKI
jgi:acyl-CoA synthetase (AMP-forming)/AMP-acid ligase II